MTDLSPLAIAERDLRVHKAHVRAMRRAERDSNPFSAGVMDLALGQLAKAKAAVAAFEPEFTAAELAETKRKADDFINNHFARRA